MNCDAVRERFLLLAEGELPAEDTVAVQAHLADCASCSSAWHETGDLAAEMRSWETPAAPPGLRERIAVALDVVDASRLPGARRSAWETATFYIAAAAVIVMAFAVASYVGRRPGGEMVAKAPGGAFMPQRGPGMGPGRVPGVSAAMPGRPGADATANEAKAVDEAIRKLQEAQKQKQLAEQERRLLLSSGGPAKTGSPPGEPSGTRSGTFAGGPEEGEPGIAAPTKPTLIEISFLPPEKPTTSETANGVVEVTAREAIPHAVLTATGDEGLTIGKPGGVLYEGPLRAGEAVRVPLPMTATKPGSHEVDLRVTSDAPGGNGQLKVFVPGFTSASEPASKPPTDPGDKPVNLVFKNVPIREALMDVARQAKLRLEMAEGLGTEVISRDVRGVPARAALRAIAEAGGYEVTEKEGVYRVTRSAAGG
jgi:Putative zinc-finger